MKELAFIIMVLSLIAETILSITWYNSPYGTSPRPFAIAMLVFLIIAIMSGGYLILRGAKEMNDRWKKYDKE